MQSFTGQLKKELLIWLSLIKGCLLAVLSLTVLAVLLWFISTVVEYFSRPTFQRLEQTLNREVPLGSSPQIAQAFLRNNQFYYSESLEKLPADKTAILSAHRGGKLKGKEDRLVYRISGWGDVANWRPGLLCGCGRGHVEFYFDAQQNLVEYIAYEWADG